MVKAKNLRDAFRGCLVGGAAGDALGYTVEFNFLSAIRIQYGENGIRSYVPAANGKAIFSDDTQMTLFTAEGILKAFEKGEPEKITENIYEAYLAWLSTQNGSYSPYLAQQFPLYRIPELHHRRAPGGTCLSALKSGEMGTLDHPLNDSCGCGGVMRVAPLGLLPYHYSCTAHMAGANAAAITHSHELGWLSAAVLSGMIHTMLYMGDEFENLLGLTEHDLIMVKKTQDGYDKQIDLLELAVDLAHNDLPDADNIWKLGGGWTGHEAIAIAFYSFLRHRDSFSETIICAANHDGDSDSTAAIAGNLAGAYWGYEAIREQWGTDLELCDTLVAYADRLYDLCMELRKTNDCFDSLSVFDNDEH